MSLSADQITIAITVYSRRQYLKQSISSALNQTRPGARHGGGGLRAGPRLAGLRPSDANSAKPWRITATPRGAGFSEIGTPAWTFAPPNGFPFCMTMIFLAPVFVEAMLELEKAAPGRCLYFGRTPATLTTKENPIDRQDQRTVAGPWMDRGLDDILRIPFYFAGHLCHVPTLRKLGGFRATSFLRGRLGNVGQTHGREGGRANQPRHRVQSFPRRLGTAAVISWRGMAAFCPWFTWGTSASSPPTRPAAGKNSTRAAFRTPQPRLPSLYTTGRRSMERSPAPLPSRPLAPLPAAPICPYRLFQWAARLGGVRFVRAACRAWTWAKQQKGPLGRACARILAGGLKNLRS